VASYSTTPVAKGTSRLDYGETLQTLYGVNERIDVVKQELENISKLDAALGNPCDDFKVLHVTGTNGKGSVCWKLANALTASGYKTGLFVSPHISSFRERMRIDGQLISEDEVVEIASELMSTAAANKIPATFFEYVTAMAFVHFSRNNCDAVVLEVGLGGRLDSTNIVKNPLVTVVTNVGIEHKKILGSTVEEIAFEKLSIAKAGTPMVIGPDVPLEVAKDVCGKASAPLHVCERVIDSDMQRDFDEENKVCVRTVLDLLGFDRARTSAALEMRPPCRFEIVDVRPRQTHILDVAHNAHALGKLFSTLELRLDSLRGDCPVERLNVQVVLALSSDKDLDKCISEILVHKKVVNKVYLTQAFSSRAQDSSVLEREFASVGGSQGVPECCVSSSVSLALEQSCVDAERGDFDKTVTLVCGSVFMMGEAREYLCMSEAVDPEGVVHKGPKL